MKKIVMLTFSLVNKNLMVFMKLYKSVFFFPSSFFPLVMVLFMLLNFGCKKSPTEPNETLSVSVEDVSCTEAWVKITSTNYQTPNTLTLYVNNEANQSITLVSSDTVLYVDSLLPNKSYTFNALLTTNNTKPITTEAQATTLDTTSHNFTWQTFTFGEHSSSTLYDVAIIDENNIWAVGEIYMNDSLGIPDPIAYNAVHWDGKEWEVKKISVEYKGNQTVAPLEGVFALPNNQIIFSSGLPYLPQSNGWKLYHLWDMGVLNQDDGGVSKIWGTSINDLYFVGRKGTIVHYDGKSWQKIESGTTTNIYDVYGITGKDGSQRIYCAVSDFETTLKGILEISNNHINTLTSNIFGNIYTSWAPNTNQLYAGGHGLFKYANNVWSKVNIDASLIYRIRGDAVNNIYAVGGSGLITHFNGVNWQHHYVEASASFKSCDIKGKTIVTVGEKNSKAIISIGKQI
ncbi:MAG: glucosyl transferase [Ignavibacteriaceae bacterium]|nr:glucosyl transferase [Ignavibacteriaceae bacterium]